MPTSHGALSADVSTDDIYAAMDWLRHRQDAIEARLAARHLARIDACTTSQPGKSPGQTKNSLPNGRNFGLKPDLQHLPEFWVPWKLVQNDCQQN